MKINEKSVKNGSNTIKNHTLNIRNREAVSNVQKKEEIKQLLKEDLTNFLCQAIVKIILTPHLILKIFLTLCVLGSISLASYLVIKSIMDYYTYGVTTTSRTISEISPLFPKVTFCNINKYATQYAWNFLTNSIDDASISLDEKKKFAHSLKDILFECWFNGYQCYSNDFTWSHDEWYGNCFTFNSGIYSNGTKSNLKQSTIPGPMFGLQLGLYVNVYQKLNALTNRLGAVIRVGNSSYSTYYPALSGILVAPGFQTNIAVDREFKTILTKPYSNCDIDSNSPQFMQGLDVYNLISQSDYEYTQQLCFIQCYQKIHIEKFNCVDILIFSLLNVTKCTSNQTFDDEFINANCVDSCPLECSKNVYKTLISSSQFVGSENFIVKIKSNLNLQSDFVNNVIDIMAVEKSIAFVNVFYDSLSYTLTTESPQIDGIKLYADIGGNLGFYLGVSLFSFFEVVELVVEIIFILKK